MQKQLHIFVDGGARGNPGPAAVGFVVKELSGRILEKHGKFIGETTNNQAEYEAVIEALKWVKSNSQPPTPNPQLTLYLDSRLIVSQLNGLFRVKNGHLREKIILVRQLEKAVGGQVSYRAIARNQNQLADALVNQALNKKLFSA